MDDPEPPGKKVLVKSLSALGWPVGEDWMKLIDVRRSCVGSTRP